MDCLDLELQRKIVGLGICVEDFCRFDIAFWRIQLDCHIYEETITLLIDKIKSMKLERLQLLKRYYAIKKIRLRPYLERLDVKCKKNENENILK